jgi:hypothetical protein
LSGLSQSWCARGSVELTRAPGLHADSRETLEEERLSYLRSFQRHAAMEDGEVRSVVALKPGVGDHAHERLAGNELGSWNNQRDIWQIEIALAKRNSFR